MSFELVFLISFVTAGFTSFCVASVCEKPLSIFYRRIIKREISSAFAKYVKYATCLVGISHGVTVNPLGFELRIHVLEGISIDSVFEHLEWWMWFLWIQPIIMQSLITIAAMYLAFFTFGFIAYITVKARET